MTPGHPGAGSRGSRPHVTEPRESVPRGKSAGRGEGLAGPGRARAGWALAGILVRVVGDAVSEGAGGKGGRRPRTGDSVRGSGKRTARRYVSDAQERPDSESQRRGDSGRGAGLSFLRGAALGGEVSATVPSRDHG